jgi:hypothetical protein
MVCIKYTICHYNIPFLSPCKVVYKLLYRPTSISHRFQHYAYKPQCHWTEMTHYKPIRLNYFPLTHRNIDIYKILIMLTIQLYKGL